jgi:peptidoglycan/xylan/chitin deacetylase (PgdA/CDA1 family)
LRAGPGNAWWQRAFRAADDVFMDAAAKVSGHRPSLIVLMFHGLYRNKAEAFSDHVDPYQPITETDFRRVIEHFQGAGYQFVSPDHLSLGLRNAPKRVMLTFDDGYANNLRALPLLKQYGVPATFFVTAGNVASGEAFWWDVLHREMSRRGIGRASAVAERQRLKAMPTYAIKNTLRAMFGGEVLSPAGETDRPLNPAEVRALAAEPLATVGNHSTDHDLLTRIPAERARKQIAECQAMLAEWTGKAPKVIAYPNGNCDETIVRYSETLGLRTGLTATPGRTRLPLDSSTRMQLPRFALVGGDELGRQLRAVEAPVSLSHIKNHLLHRRRQQAAFR